MQRRLDGMVVVITGASAGIGRTLAEQLAQRGAKLVLAARRRERLAALCRSLGEDHLFVPTDVSQPEQCEQLIGETINRFGRVDTLVCNAGYGLIRPVAETSEADLLDLFRANVLGTTTCIRCALPHLLGQAERDGHRGQVLAVSSASSRRGLPDLGAYTASKAAQASIMESLRVELRGSGVAVSSVHPVTTETEFFRAAIRLSRTRPPRRSFVESAQTPHQVAATIMRAIQRPRPEVWPHPWTRVLLGMGAFAPRVVDWILSRRRHLGIDQRNGALPRSPMPVPATAEEPPDAIMSLGNPLGDAAV